MEKELEWIDPVRKIKLYHAGIHQGFQVFEGIKKGITDAELSAALGRAEDFLCEYFTDHFQLEEELLFPVVLQKISSPDSTGVIPALRKEHDDILQEADKCQKIFYSSIFPYTLTYVDELNAIFEKIKKMAAEHVSKEDSVLLPKIKDSMVFLHPDMRIVLDARFSSEKIASRASPVPLELQEALGVMKALSDCQLISAMFYRACARKFQKESAFWLDIAKDKVANYQYSRKMMHAVSREQGDFSPAGAFQISEIQATASEIREYIKRLGAGTMFFNNALFMAKDVERLFVERKYDKIVQTQNLRYQFYSGEISSITLKSRDKVDRKIFEDRKSQFQGV